MPVDVDAVLFWKVLKLKKAALDVADCQSAISWAARTALRDVIWKTVLSDMLEAVAGRGSLSIRKQLGRRRYIRWVSSRQTGASSVGRAREDKR